MRDDKFFDLRFTRIPSPHMPVRDRGKKHIQHGDHTFTVSKVFYKRAATKRRSLTCNVCLGSVKWNDKR